MTNCNNKQLNLTITFWKGTSCSTMAPVPQCTTTGLEYYMKKSFVFGEKDKDTLCLSIPGLDPAVADPAGVLFPHSGGLDTSTKNLTNWDDVMGFFCNKTAGMLQFAFFTGPGCVTANKVMEGAAPLNFVTPFVNTPFGAQYNYTEYIECNIINGASTIYTNVMLLITLFAMFLF
jgi:hypothetical protein